MEAILKFNLPEDNQEFKLATNAQNWWSVCWEMDQWLRAQYKYMPDNEYSKDKYDAYVEAREKLEADGIKTRVVSAPCVEWFDEQSAEYKESVLPSSVEARVSVEAGLSLGWSKYVGRSGESVSIEHFGASADYKTLFREFGMTTDAVIAAAHKSLRN